MAPGISESYVQYREYVIEFTYTTGELHAEVRRKSEVHHLNSLASALLKLLYIYYYYKQ